MKVQIKILNKEFYKRKKLGCEYYDLPDYQTFGSAAMDLYCTEDVVLYPGETKMLFTGLAININNDEVAAIILPRSGLGTKGLVLANTIGLIDSDYTGELKISAWNRNPHKHKNGHRNTDQRIELKVGDRIAQLTFMPVIKAQWEIVDEFNNKSERGNGGFGSTGD
jgi:dUTP pyrophosphatase